MECEAQIVQNECDCVMYYMPRINADTNICGRSADECYSKVRKQVDASEDDASVCNCLPGCFAMSYDSDLSFSKIVPNGKVVQESLLKDVSHDFVRENVAVLHIYYKENFFRSQTKEELIGFTEFLCKSFSIDEIMLINESFQQIPAACWVCSWASVSCLSSK